MAVPRQRVATPVEITQTPAGMTRNIRSRLQEMLRREIDFDNIGRREENVLAKTKFFKDLFFGVGTFAIVNHAKAQAVLDRMLSEGEITPREYDMGVDLILESLRGSIKP